VEEEMKEYVLRRDLIDFLHSNCYIIQNFSWEYDHKQYKIVMTLQEICPPRSSANHNTIAEMGNEKDIQTYFGGKF
jgi:hypothetical protein